MNSRYWLIGGTCLFLVGLGILLLKAHLPADTKPTLMTYSKVIAERGGGTQSAEIKYELSVNLDSIPEQPLKGNLSPPS